MSEHLTPREVEVIRLASLGCTVEEAAKILKLAANTVDNHKAHAMAKLGTDKAALLTKATSPTPSSWEASPSVDRITIGTKMKPI